MVLSKVGGAGSFAILSISVRFSAIADSSAGLKYSTLTLSNGGTPPKGPCHVASKGFGSAAELLAAEELLNGCVSKPAKIVNMSSVKLLFERVRIIWISFESKS